MDSTSGGAGSSDPNSGEGPSSATAPAGQSLSPSRYESQKRRDWNTFGQYLKNQRPPLTLARCIGVHGDLPAKAIGRDRLGGCVWVLRDRLVIAHSASLRATPVRDRLAKGHSASLWAPLLAVLATMLSNQGESPGSGGRAGEERNGGGGDGNQGIGGGVGGGGQREGIGNERRGSRGSGHGGGNGDDDDNDRGGGVRSIEDEMRPMGPRPDRMAEILLPFNFQIFATVESLDITALPVRVRMVRVVSLGFTSVALVCLSASIRQRGTNPTLASILSWIGSGATFLGFILMIAMALSASFIP